MQPVQASDYWVSSNFDWLKVWMQTNSSAHLLSTFLQFLDQDRIVTASSTGAVTILHHHQNIQVHAGKVMSVCFACCEVHHIFKTHHVLVCVTNGF